MKVRAIQQGFYNNKRVAAGEVFPLVPYKAISKEPIYKKNALGEESLVGYKDGKEKEFTAEDQFSESWMEKAEGKDEGLNTARLGKPARVQAAPDARDIASMIGKLDAKEKAPAVKGQSDIGVRARRHRDVLAEAERADAKPKAPKAHKPQAPDKDTEV